MESLKIKHVLIPQPAPAEIEKSPYYPISKKYNIKFDYVKLFEIEGCSSLEFRQQKISLFDYNAVIFTSKHAIDNYFRLAKDIRMDMPENMKYLCISETIALYLQKYIPFRKRKIFHTQHQLPRELLDLVKKHKSEKFFLPLSENSWQETDSLKDALTSLNVNFGSAAMYRSIPSDLSKLQVDDYDMLVFFSPIGVQGFLSNFPDFKQEDKIIAAFGKGTHDLLTQLGYNIGIVAPTITAPSMATAIDDFLSGKMKPKRK